MNIQTDLLKVTRAKSHKVTTSLALDKETFDDFKRHCKRLKRTPSDVLRYFVELFLSQQSKTS